jgi:pSer/pThr/pTyr-binding forkhead associated (FHA) protein
MTDRLVLYQGLAAIGARIMAILIVTEGPFAGQKFALADHRLVMLGRDASCTFQIIDPKLSRNHLQIKLMDDERRHVAVDFGSKNGVLVNDEKIEEPTPLQHQDVIRIGDSTLVYSTDDTLDAKHVRQVGKMFGQGHMQTSADD